MRFNLHTKVLVSLILLFIVALASMGLLLLKDADARLQEFMLIQAKGQVRTLAGNSIDALLVKDYPLLENLVNVANSEKHYAFSAIVSPKGLVYSHSDFNQVGDIIPTNSPDNGITVRAIKIKGRDAWEIIHPMFSGKEHLGSAHLAFFSETDSSLSGKTISWLAQILIVMLVGLTLGSLLITKHFTRHIIDLTNVVKHNLIDHHLEIDSSILKRTDEVGALANAFKNMSDQLVDRLEELKHQIRERDNARAANKTKSAFLANVSHELRTPLNAIIGYSEILLEDAISTNSIQNQADLDKISSSAKHLNSLIDDMLDLSKIEAGKLVIAVDEIEVQSLIDEVVSSVRPLIFKNNNSINVKWESDPGMVLADPLRLKQVLFNLMSNSAKFTERGDITVSISSNNNNILFVISDTGIGMTEEQLGKVFEAFAQADSKTAEKYGGTGLGLTISLRLCQMMNGNLRATSQAGKGSIFTVTMPAAKPLQNAATG